MKTAVRIGIVVIALAAVGAYAGYKTFTGGLFSGVEAAVEIGQKVPDVTLQDSDGKEHSLAQYTKDGKVVVIEFCSQECPFSRGADSDFVELAKTYGEKGVVFLGIDSHKDATADKINGYKKESGKNYPILIDTDNKYADVIGAKVTPEVLVIDKDGTLKYHGAFDNRTSPEGEADQHYTKDAIEAVLAGKKPNTEKTSAWGCGIKRK